MNTARSTSEILTLLGDGTPVDPVSRISFDGPIFRERERALLRDLVYSIEYSRSERLSVKDAPFNAMGDALTGVNGAITTGTPNFSSAGAGFLPTDVGKSVFVVGAGVAGAMLVTTILAYVSANAVTLAANAATTVAGATYAFGTDDTAALAAWRIAAQTTHNRAFIPPGLYISTTEFAPTANMTIEGHPDTSIILFVGATNGLYVRDNTGNPYPRVHIMGGLNVQTINPGALTGAGYDTPTFGAGLTSIGDLSISKVGAGRWAIGFFGDNFESSEVRSLRIFNSATKAWRLQNFCNALKFQGFEITGGVVGDTSFLIGIEIDHSTDPWLVQGTVQGCFGQAACRIVNGSSPTLEMMHFENTWAAPTDGADILIDNSSDVGLNDLQGGSIKYSGTIRGGTVKGGNHGPVVFGSGVQDVEVVGGRCVSLTDNDGNNGWRQCRDSTGAQFIDKPIKAESLKPRSTGSATLAGLNSINTNAVAAWPNGGVVQMKDTGGTYRDVWIPISGASQMILQFIASVGAMIFRNSTPVTKMQINDTGVGIGAAGTVLQEVKKYSPNLTPALVAANSVVEQTFAVTGLVPGDHVTVSGPAPVAGTACIGARCGVADNVILTFINTTAGGLTPSAGFYRITQVR